MNARLQNITITKNMQDMAKMVYNKCWARENLDYMLALEIYEQLNDKHKSSYLPFAWEMEQDIIDKATELNDVLFKQYVEGSF